MKYYFVQSYQKYPLMRLEDFVKQAYQAQFGCGHLLGGNVEQYIRNEMVKASPTGNLWDAIGNGMCRVNLGDCQRHENFRATRHNGRVGKHASNVGRPCVGAPCGR